MLVIRVRYEYSDEIVIPSRAEQCQSLNLALKGHEAPQHYVP